MKVEDSVKDIFMKYFVVEQDVQSGIQEILLGRMNSSVSEIGDLGDKYETIKHLKGESLLKNAFEILDDF